MNKGMRTKLAAAAGAMAVLGAGSANLQAEPIDFILNETISVKFQDYEFANTDTGENIGGIFRVTSIENLDGNPLWADTLSDGTRLHGFFSNINITSGTGGGTGDVLADGGLLVLYNVPAATPFLPATLLTGIDPVTQLCGAAACPQPWLTAVFVPGIVAPGASTLFGQVNGTTPITGVGNGYLSVADLDNTAVNDGAGGSFNLNAVVNAAVAGAGLAGLGIHNANFNTNGFGPFAGGFPNADMSFRSGFDQCGFPTSPPQCANIADDPAGAFSNDPVAARVVAVPEPGTIALLGALAIGLGLGGRRKRS